MKAASALGCSPTSQGGGAKGQRQTCEHGPGRGSSGAQTDPEGDSELLESADVRCSPVELRPLTFQQGTGAAFELDLAQREQNRWCCRSSRSPTSLRTGRSSHRTAARSECPAAAGEESGSWCRRSRLPSSGPPRPGRSSRRNPPGRRDEKKRPPMYSPPSTSQQNQDVRSRPPPTGGHSSGGSRPSPPSCPRSGLCSTPPRSVPGPNG